MEAIYYTIRVEEQLDEHWSEWFEGLALGHGPDGSTELTGPIADGAALFGVLDRIRDLGLTLLSVQRINPTDA
jgi:hypothetical protein